uniref:NADH dehydrogenase subunit 6 n=1 Tax=Neurobasis chinensis TaxID=62024 RepID=UPI0021159407|nr:NADH dehydrogenase subunit 6 [Neurobasis chinensis]UTB53951.1 NADH dehydrogenase subunit 6 [Neurobasis chinensis]
MSQIMLWMSMMNTMIFSLMKHPMSMGVALMMQTVLICFITNNMAQNAWFSYILFLVFLGGMLVLFIYLTSVASNDMFGGKNYNRMIIYVMVLVMSMLMFMVVDTMEMNNTEETKPISMGETNNMMMMFNYPYNTMTVVVILYLFLTLIVVVKITESHSGPLRSN